MANVPIEGYCDPAFSAVREAFALNMSGDHEIGACAALVVDGRMVVDLWGGYRDAARTRPWQRDTIVCTMSVTKAVSAFCILMLADRGRLDLDQPVAAFWPGFAANGKAAITVRMVLAQLASLPYLDALKPGDLWDFDKVRRAIEAQAPEWPPGSKPCYHSFSAGHLYQQIMRHVDGRSIGRFLREEVNEPFGIDFAIGLTQAEDARRAQYVVTPGTPSWEGILGRKPSPLNRAWASLERDEDINSANWRFKEFPSANGHATARAAARLYAGLAGGGTIAGKRLIGDAVIRDATREQWDGMEAMTNRHFRYGTGFMLSAPPFPVGGNPRNFGHPGVGGATAFGDPDRRLGFAYAGNHMAPVADAGPYATRLIDTVYACF